MTNAIKWCCCPLLIVLLLATVPSAHRVQGRDFGDMGTADLAGDWWTISDSDFVQQHGNLATGTQKQQAQFAWMTFARVNQQVASAAS